MALKLSELLNALEEEGVTGEESDRLVEQFLERRKKSGKLAKRDEQRSIEPVFSAQQELARGRPSVDYGDETPEQAKERWMSQEMEDPDGLFAGGSTGGGIFGDAPIALEGYDPGARRRAAEMTHLRASTQEKMITVQVMTKLAERLGMGKDELEGLLGDGGSPGHRRLAGRR